MVYLHLADMVLVNVYKYTIHELYPRGNGIETVKIQDRKIFLPATKMELEKVPET